jgi:amino acid permease
LHDSYPSYGVYSISAIGTYLALATSEFSSTTAAMGPEWASRSKVAYTFIALVIIAFLAARWRSCDSIGEIMAAVSMAFIVGAIFFYVNKSLFGEEAMNFLGLPYLVSKDSQGAPIYICSADTTNPDTA